MTEKLHIIPHNHEVSAGDRRQLHGHNSFVVWFVGLSGSGKSTLANALEKRLFEAGKSTYILDGDNIRSGLNKDLDFSEESRRENIRRIGEVAKLMVDAGKITITAFISPFKEERDMVRQLVGHDRYLLVYVDCPIEECERRDVKGLYAKARRGEISNFTGINSPFEVPQNPFVSVKSAEMSVDEATDIIFNKIEPLLKLSEQ